MPYFYYYWDPTYILILIGAVISMIASARVRSTYHKYARVHSMSGMTGQQTAEKILRMNGIHDVTIERVRGELTDHYDPRNKVIRLSAGVYDSASVAAIGVAAHECGHVLQHAGEYVPLKVRGALVPIVNFGSYASWFFILAGLFWSGESSSMLIRIGIFLFSFAVLFQLVTLPVEFNASKRALKVLESGRILREEELPDAKKVLGAAAMTYVAAVIAALLQMWRAIIIAGGRRGEYRDNQ